MRIKQTASEKREINRAKNARWRARQREKGLTAEGTPLNPAYRYRHRHEDFVEDLTMLLDNGLTRREVAEKMGLATNTITKRLARKGPLPLKRRWNTAEPVPKW